MVAAGGGGGPRGLSAGVPRLCAAGSLALLSIYSIASYGVSVEPWPLGGPSQGGPFLAGTSLALGLLLGWGVPGISLAFLTDRSLQGAALLARSLGLGVGYIVVTGLGYAIIAGHAPERAVLLGLLAVPPLVLLGKVLRPAGPVNASQRDPVPGRNALATVALTAMVALTGILWAKLAHEGLNGDGTEAYELARSLADHPVPRWDLERWDGPGRFGTPAVNPFLTNSYLVQAGMTVMGRGELAARLPLVPAVVIAVVLAGSLASRPGRSGWAYLMAVAALYVLWNAYYVGYEPPFPDLAEPAATDTMMVALWLAGFAEVVAGVEWIGVASLVLAAFILYSAPVLTVPALVAFGFWARRWRPLLLYCGAGALAAGLALAYGAASGDLADWLRQVRSEYWYDLVDQTRRSATGRFAALLLLLTGGLPLLALVRWRRLSASSRALLCAAGLYLAVALLSSYKNLHYLAPLPFLLAPAALQATGPRSRTAAAAIVVAAFFLSWPSPAAIHRDTVELGEKSCAVGMGYEEASLAGDVVYRAFAPTGQAERFAVGKHTFVRYALQRGGRDCALRLSPARDDGWIPLAGTDVTLATSDVDAYAGWRLRQPPVPTSLLFPGPARVALPALAEAWPAAIDLGGPPGSALVIEDFDPRDTTRPRARLLLPLSYGMPPGPWLRVRGPHPAVRLEVRVNGHAPTAMDVSPESSLVNLSDAVGWWTGWNILEVHCRPAGLTLEAFLQGPGSP